MFTIESDTEVLTTNLVELNINIVEEFAFPGEIKTSTGDVLEYSPETIGVACRKGSGSWVRTSTRPRSRRSSAPRVLRAVRRPALCRPRAPSQLMTAPRSRTMRSLASGHDGSAKRRANDHSGQRGRRPIRLSRDISEHVPWVSCR